MYLTGILVFLCVQFYYLYHERYDLSVVRMIKEEFITGKQYYFYCYFLILLVKLLLYTFLLVFASERPYAAPAVTCVMNLVICKSYLVSYLLSMKPYTTYRNVVLLSINGLIECLLVITPILYENQTVSELVLDVSSISLFFVGTLVYSLRIYFDSSGQNSQVSVKPDLPSFAVVDESMNRSVDDLVKKTKEDLNGGLFVKTVKPINYKVNLNGKAKDTEKNVEIDGRKGSKPGFFVFPKDSDGSVNEEPGSFEEKTPDFHLPSEGNASSKAIKHFGNFLPQSAVASFDNRPSHLLPPSVGQFNQHTPNIRTPNSSSGQSSVPRSKPNLNNFTVRSYIGE